MVTNNQDNPKSGGKRGLIIAFIIILLAINGVQLWLNLSKDQEIVTKEKTIQEQKTEINNTKKELDNVIKELEQKKAQLAELGGDTARLSRELEGLKVERDRLSKESRLNKKRYDELLARIEDANRLKDQAEQDLVYWKGIAERTMTENQQLKQQKENFIDSLKKLNLTAEQLADKVAVASVLKAENIRFEAINNKGKAKEGSEFRVKSIEKLRVRFNIGENNIARIENKDVYLRIIEPDGAALFDLATGGGMFKSADGKEIPYTLKTDVLFDNKKPEVGFTYLKGNPFKLGRHVVEVYSEGHSIGIGSFVVK